MHPLATPPRMASAVAPSPQPPNGIRMARFLRKVQLRLKRMSSKPESAGRVARVLIRGYRIPTTRRDQVLLRLHAGLRGLYARLHASKA